MVVNFATDAVGRIKRLHTSAEGSDIRIYDKRAKLKIASGDEVAADRPHMGNM